MQPLPKARSDTRERILEAALDLFSVKGFEGVTVREISRKIGLTEGSLYNHFVGKVEILESLYEGFTREFNRIEPPAFELEKMIPVLDIGRFLENGLDMFLAAMTAERMEKIWRLLSIEQYRDRRAMEILQGMMKSPLRFLEDFFGKLAAAGRIKPVEPKLLAMEYQYPLFSLISEYQMLKFNGQDTTGIQPLMREHIRYFTSTIVIP